MSIWKSIEDEKPSKSDIYRVKMNSTWFTFEHAYYDSVYDVWFYYDGCRLPRIVTSNITHWAER